MRQKTLKNKQDKERKKRAKLVKNLLEKLALDNQPINLMGNIDEYQTQVQEFFGEEENAEVDFSTLSLGNLNSLGEHKEQKKKSESDDESGENSSQE